MAAADTVAPAETVRTDVLVVGAGPSGLMAADMLAKLGVDAIVVDGKDGPTRESRALVVQARSMELYDQLGLADRVLAQRGAALGAVLCFRHRVLGEIPFREFGAATTPFPDITVFEQSRNERLLVDALGERGGEVRWEHRLVALEPHAASVTARLEAPGGPVEIDARWVVGADGAHSAVRELCRIPFEGVTNEHTFFVADAVGASGLVEGRVNIRMAPDDLLLSFPMGEPGHARILGVVRDADLAAGGELPEALVRSRIARGFTVGYRSSTWFATYRLHHRVAARFRDGRCFIVGDAAHIHSPVGGQGMNTGLQDAHNLACALADVLVGGMPERRLDRYEAERRPVARKLVATTDRLFGLVTADTALTRFIRGRAIPAMGPIAIRLLPRIIGGPRLFGFLSQTRIRYRMSLTRPPRSQARDDVVGKRLPFAGGDPSNFDSLRPMRWQVHGYGAPADLVGSVAERLGIDHHVFPPDANGRLRSDRLYLVRPDGFVAAEASVTAGRAARAGRPEAVPASFREQLSA
ncbi:2-polyprenyl-6-methoxyphenol hydroxylase-like FAD-dependent oxidoreductase [Agromyces flavus]|uniref:2-polyprenyl-6-methoxyphenol hydroxylase n=1 Tax=Agromyces flavus TaxID=589382 RepID=A0A1H1YPG2_9MICO|nr:FAD-dependent monooxygenase [Agromyces flavus]MCP2366762.1 2-polyprenyl-6-methoxyphenol hydroxylase-like FAD-dependent oxidoreductase [Agromyces flavus]GGI45319.1 2-polyprenyl-6-methoxyphenol hydroxylase [Agromyces flavus]SDT23324.1 2-polyprenyl-6-methoxyphenol hydroxylase [Agromyces flavus]